MVLKLEAQLVEILPGWLVAVLDHGATAILSVKGMLIVKPVGEMIVFGDPGVAILQAAIVGVNRRAKYAAGVARLGVGAGETQ